MASSSAKFNILRHNILNKILKTNSMRTLQLSFFLVISNFLYCQNHPKISFRSGVLFKSFKSPTGNKSFAHKSFAYTPIRPSGVGIEFSKSFKSKNELLIIGGYYCVQAFGLTGNQQNFQSGGYSGTLSTSSGYFQIYTGVEKAFTDKDFPENQNYFSVFGGLNLTYNKPGNENGGGISFSTSDGITRDGRVYRGVYKSFPSNPNFNGYYVTVSKERKSIVSAGFFAGSRYHINNKKGKNLFTPELILNYGLSKNYDRLVKYTLDNIIQYDRLKEIAFSIQFNFLIPLKTFGHKKYI